ncbi:Mfa1 family fimbria major subunit [Bacteroides caecigallinarum]|uniref:Mfa1 family fimbria major subunit n=1 Tax=Bacteroides caecigallinarum TaxID=1411144 RepID=UPI00195DC336|nr:Mfa1 family fimbria major subunit [Bacteroides caecigallinarum]MBM6883253.1 Mfa1 fimbrilin C-terminal domain-containing protein [Bacteroides caecigallinarum]
MGNLKYFSLLMVAGMFAACSDNLENPGNENDGPKTGEGYVKVAINLPSVSSSRAFDENNNLDDGDKKEYAVKNGIIAFFEGVKTDGENAAKLVKAYYMGTLTGTPDNDKHVSSTVTVQTLDAPMLSDDKNQMYALVILNNGLNNSIVSVENDGKRLSFKSGDAPIILEAGTSTINDLYGKWSLNASDITSDANGFLMLNSPLYNGTKAQTLVPVTVSKTKDGAETANIYVERVVAKVDVSINPTSPGDYFTENNRSGLSVKKDGSIYTGDKVVFIDESADAPKLGWTLNVTNKNTKPLRNVSSIATWLGYGTIKSYFIGNTAVYEEGTEPNKISWKRIYWAIDNNYDATATDFNVYNETNKPEDKSWGAYSTSTIVPQYCLENTASAANVKDNNTTAVLIKATYWVDEIADSEDKSFFMIDDNAATVTKADFLEKVKNTLDPNGTASLTLGINEKADGGYYTGAEELKTLITGISGNTYDTALDELGTIRYYKDGGCYYYAVPIKHFNDITKPSGTIEDSNFLGAYGVVRNNWYQITINSVSGPGAPGVTDPGEGGVEDEEGYIKCSINILSWAKRTQGVEL